MLTWQDFPVDRWAKKRPTQIALTLNNIEYSWRALATEVDVIVEQLTAQGLSSNDVLTLIGKNSLEGLLNYLACLKLGILCAFLMPAPCDKLTERLNVIYRTGQRRFIYTDPHTRQIIKQEQSTQRLKKDEVITSYLSISLNQPTKQGTKALTPIYRQAAKNWAKRPSSLIFTSGSTGSPKAVAHSAQQHFYSASGLLSVLCFTQDDNWLLNLPLYHVSGLAIVYRWLSVGAQLTLSSGDLSQDVQKITHASLVHTQLQQLLALDVKSSLTHVLLGASAINQQMRDALCALGVEAWMGYGMTEAASTVTVKRLTIDESTPSYSSDTQQALTALPPSSGQVLPYRQIRLVDGEVYLRGKTLALGYYHQGKLTDLRTPLPEGTKGLSCKGKPTTLSNRADNNFWFRSKDLAQWAGDELIILGRTDNQFISGGENMHCEEIELALSAHPKVSQAIVLPIDDSRYGKRPIAFIRCSDRHHQGIASCCNIGLDAAPNRAMRQCPAQAHLNFGDFLANTLEKFKCPDNYYPLPPQVAGAVKISRAELAHWFKSHQDNLTATSSTPIHPKRPESAKPHCVLLITKAKPNG